MKKILILTPVYKRPEILQLFLEGYKRISKYYPLILVCIVSPEDRFYDVNVKMIIKYGGDICEWSNKYLGDKKNRGLEFALNEYDFDYFMDLGSDNILNPEIFQLYKACIDGTMTFFGMNNLYVHDWYTKKTIFIENYNGKHCFGAGRMLHRKAISLPLWPENSNDGLDSQMRRGLERRMIDEYVINVAAIPYLLDIKTNTNLSHFLEVWNMRKREVEFRDIAGYFGINIYDNDVMEMQIFEKFDQLIQEKIQWGYDKEQAYDIMENVYKMYFFKKKYKNYDTYRRIKLRHGH